ncbi:MAG: hypothetical protein EKK64_02345 [Neisseriaceae bacterium]|nr:MAG: hypothetical protein EKK64_02345 [Neisseriaceae bacterium]
MDNETFRPRRPNKEDEGQATHQPQPQDEAQKLKISGQLPEAMLKAIHSVKKEQIQEIEEDFDENVENEEVVEDHRPVMQRPKHVSEQRTSNVRKVKNSENGMTTNEHLNEMLNNLKIKNTNYEEIVLPSKGRFYDGENGPSSGIISIRPMTGEEEQILATTRFVKRGEALNMIFKNCIKERYAPENYLTIDRTYILIYLRAISYSANYEVEVKCPHCDKKFGHTIKLDQLNCDYCPDGFGPALEDALPDSGYEFSYRLSTGKDEKEISDYRERRIKIFGDEAVDDTLTYRTAKLLRDINGISLTNELQAVLKNLPIGDVAYIRNCITEPPFGVETNINIICANCLEDFDIDLPLEANFFFPRRKKAKTQA